MVLLGWINGNTLHGFTQENVDITSLLPHLIKIPKTLLSSENLHEGTNKTN